MIISLKNIKFVVYLRLSKKRKGKDGKIIEDGLGIQAQQKYVADLIAQYPNGKVVAEYTEIETGTAKKIRPRLQEAIAHATLSKATLIIAKLDRLARDTYLISSLHKADVNFICCDNPFATRLTINILAAVAEDEADRIGQRTKDCMAVLRERGVKLGSANPKVWAGREHLRGFKAAGEESGKRRTENALKKYGFLMPNIRAMRKAGKSLKAIAAYLNSKGHATTRGKDFSATAVLRIIELFNREQVTV